MKDALKSLLEENSDEAFEFLSRYSSRTFLDIENEDKIQDKLFESLRNTRNSGRQTNLKLSQNWSQNLREKRRRKSLNCPMI